MMDFINFTGNLTEDEVSNIANINSTTVSEQDILTPAVDIIFMILYGLQGSIAIGANLLSIIAVCKFDFLREDCACRFVASLALADFVAGIGAYISIAGSAMSTAHSSWSLICEVELFLQILSVLGNVYNILCVTIDRLIYIIRPLRYISIVTEFRTQVAIYSVWSAIVIQTVLLIVFDVSVNEKRCTVRDASSDTGYHLILAQIGGITCLIIVPCYIVIMWTSDRLKKTEPHVTHFAPELQAEQIEKLKQRKMAKTMGLVLGTFILCYALPLIYRGVVFKLYTAPLPLRFLVGERISKLIFWFQFMANPFIYGWRNKAFSKAYRKLLGLKPSQVGCVIHVAENN